MIKKLHIFTPFGHTYTFQNVYSFVVNESVITFSFKAMSDGQIKQATFFVKNICGYTKLDEPNLEDCGKITKQEYQTTYKNLLWKS